VSVLWYVQVLPWANRGFESLPLRHAQYTNSQLSFAFVDSQNSLPYNIQRMDEGKKGRR